MRSRARAGVAVVAGWSVTAIVLVTLPGMASTPAHVARSSGSALRINDVQVVGTHNSYHVEPTPAALQAITSVDPELANLAYTHPSLVEQLQGEHVHQLELDAFADPDGTLWRPLGTPGFKVFHMEQVDMSSNCELLVGCLRSIKRWSDHSPEHLPLFVLLQPNDDITLPGPPNPVPITTPVLDSLDAEIRSVFPARDLITPDDVRGDAATLEAAVLEGNWPHLDAARGKIVFLALGDAHTQYVAGHPNLEGRVMFMASTPGQPDAAFVNIDDPRGDAQATIQDLVRKGYLVRTRADDPVTTPSLGDITQRDAAFSSGAQIVSTDYPTPGSASRWNNSTYDVRFPVTPTARCNPVRTTPRTCRPADLSERAR